MCPVWAAARPSLGHVCRAGEACVGLAEAAVAVGKGGAEVMRGVRKRRLTQHPGRILSIFCTHAIGCFF